MSNLFIDACYSRETPRTPVWMMRQAGRYLEEYRELRKKHDFWTVCRTPDLAREVTLQPIKVVKTDAAILFSDILVVLPPLGLDVEFAPGPKIGNPVTSSADIERLARFEVAKELDFVFKALGQIKASLDDDTALIGFCGAPLTLAAYMVEGGKGRNFETLKSLFYDRPKMAHQLLDLLVDVQGEYLTQQINAGAQAVQIFDTWAGSMPRGVIEEFVIPKITTLVDRVKRDGVPVIYFMKDAAHALDLLARTGADVLSLDDKVPLDVAAEKIGPGPALQGNLDSAVLYASKEVITSKVKAVLDSVPEGRGHIFNLGHGILPTTPVENAIHMIEEVKRLSAKG